jgi:hypothetical protein
LDTGGGAGMHPPFGSDPHPASLVDSLQIDDTKFHTVSTRDGWLAREPMRARARMVLRIGAFS